MNEDRALQHIRGVRAHVGSRTLAETLGITPEDFRHLERLASAKPLDEVPVPDEAVRRLETAGLVFVMWSEGTWAMANPTPAGVSVLDTVNRIHRAKSGLIDIERI